MIPHEASVFPAPAPGAAVSPALSLSSSSLRGRKGLRGWRGGCRPEPSPSPPPSHGLLVLRPLNWPLCSRFPAVSPEMEFMDMDINLTKGSSLLLHAVHSLFYWRILKTIILLSGFKNPYRKIRETRKLESIHEYHCVERKNEGRKPMKNLSRKRLEFMPRNLD